MRAAMLRYDFRLQFRNGFYYAYVVVCIFYIAVLRLLPVPARDLIMPVIILTDPAVLGFFFIGGIVLLEKDENTLISLFSTPATVGDYILSKAVTLTVLSILTSTVIAVAVMGFRFNWFLLMLGVIPSSVLFVIIGLIAASRFKSVNKYLGGGVPIELLALAPLLEYFGLFHSDWLYLLPARGPLKLIAGAFGRSLTAGEAVLSFVSILPWIVFTYIWASRWFEKYVVMRSH